MSSNSVVCRNQIKPVFKRSTLALVVMATSTQLSAQQVEEEVFIRGVKANLLEAADIKREADRHVDAISAKDIGSLPDVSVLEAVQRIPGVSIERFAASDDPDHFSVEGSGVLLRGLPQTRSEFNGRDSFSAGSGRGLSFQDVSPELMGSVEVIKSQTADMIEGGISGSINLNTRKPLDQEGLKVAGSLQGNYSDFRHDGVGEMTPAFSGLVSNVFDMGFGRIGTLISHSQSKHEMRTDGVEAGLWESRVIDGLGDRWVPRNAGIRRNDIDRERNGTSAVLQFEDNSERLRTTLEYFSQNASQDWTEFAFYEDNNSGSPSADAEFNDVSFVRGTVAGIDRLSGQVRRKYFESSVSDLSFDMAFQATDNLALNVDIQWVDAEIKDTDLSTYSSSIRQDIYMDFSGSVMSVDFRAPGVGDDPEANAAYFAEPDSYLHLAAMDHLERSEGEEFAIKLDAEYQFDNEYFDSVETGVRFAERDQVSRWANYNWNPTGAPWTPVHVWLDGTEDTNWSWSGSEVKEGTAEAKYGEQQQYTFENFHRGNAGDTVENLVLWGPRRDTVANYENWLSWVNVFPNAVEGGVPVSNAPHPSLGARGSDSDPIVDQYYLGVERNRIIEKNTAAYVKLNFSDAQDRLSGNVGLRWIHRDFSSGGGNAFKDPSLGLAPEFVALFDPALLSYMRQDSVSSTVDDTYSKILPSLNIRYELIDSMYIRFAASKSIAFPELGLARNNLAVELDNVQFCFDQAGGATDSDGDGCFETQGAPGSIPQSTISDGLKAGAGNPSLKPMESNNFDLSWEWYYSHSGQLSMGVFHKDIKHFFATANTPTVIPGEGISPVVNVNGPVNQGSGRLKGFELAYHQFFDRLPWHFDGLGVQFTYSNLDEDSIPNQNTRPVQVDIDGRTTPPFENLPLQGLSKRTINVIGLYEKGPVSARLAYNYRSEYLLTLSQANLKVPMHSDEIGQLDASFFYRFTDNLEAGIQAANLLNDVVSNDVQVNAEGLRLPRSSFVTDRRFSFVLKANF